MQGSDRVNSCCFYSHLAGKIPRTVAADPVRLINLGNKYESSSSKQVFLLAILASVSENIKTSCESRKALGC